MDHKTLSFWLLALILVGVLVIARFLVGAIIRLGQWIAPRIARPARRLATRTVGRRRFIDAIAARFPQSSARVAARFATDRFSGLPLTLIVVLGGYLASLGSDLAEDVIEGDAIVHMDHTINAALAPLRNPDLLQVFSKITHLADVMTLVAVVMVSAAFLWADRRAQYIPGLMLAVLGSQALTYIGKYAIDRPRPDFLTFASAVTPSFPSGHATGAMAVYGFVAYAVGRNFLSGRLRFELGYWTAALIILIAASRLLLSVHYTSDVAAGLLVGAFWLLAGFALTEYLNERTGLANR